ncbi:hypothetical protein [Sorangium sp. So ce233]|uniref:hypothetical protein n=1 Tax=Sorangium sp. So ce233 TaxID=3133290 RepID=UPI003F614483
MDRGQALSGARHDQDAFVARLTRDGALRWSRRIGGAGQHMGLNVAVDGDEAVVVALYIDGPVAFAGETFGNVDERGVFLGKLDAQGNELWGRYEPIWLDPGIPLGLDVDAAGNIALTGPTDRHAFRSTDEHRGAFDVFVVKLDQPDFFAAKYAPDGEYLWSMRVGDEFIQEGTVAMDPSGAVVAAGNFFFSMRFGDTPDGVLSSERRDLFVTVLDP